MNRRFSLMAALVLAATSMGSIANAGSWIVGAHGGAAIPMGDFADASKGNAQTGWQVGGGIDYSISNAWRLGLDGSWNQNASGAEGSTVGGATIDEAKFKTLQIGAHTHAMIPMSGAFHPYGLLGLGMYNGKTHIKSTAAGVSTTTDSNGDSRFGGKLGVGGDWMFSPTMGIGLEAAYNMVSLDKAKSGYSSLQYVGLQAGIRYTIPSGGN